MRYILGFLGFLAVIIFLIVFIFRLSNNNQDEITPVPQLVDIASSGSLTFIEDGPIVAEENHYKIRITVNDISRRIEVIKGYEQNVVAQANFDNNSESFRQFLSALDRSGYNIDRDTRFEDEDGICAVGRRYVFETTPTDLLKRRWSTTCSEKGNLGGLLSSIVELYRKQIPDYDKFIGDTRHATGLKI